eukprot:Selendium_serpulae@DN5648_c0_g1_i1.p1
MKVHYRPIPVVLLMQALHFVATRLLLFFLGFRRIEFSDTLRFYTWSPQSRSQNKPLVFLHGFGFGLVPYIPCLLFFWAKERFYKPAEMRRHLIFPEFGWLGCTPLGNLYSTDALSGLLWDFAGRLAGDNLSVPAEVNVQMPNVNAQKRIFCFLAALGGFVELWEEFIDFPTNSQPTTGFHKVSPRKRFKGLPGLSLPSMTEIVENIKCVVETTTGSSDKKWDLVAHSYGTAVASCLCSTNWAKVDRAVLIDPICFTPHLAKKAQLVRQRPWNVILYDRPLATAEAGSMSLRGRVSHGVARFWEALTDRMLLIVYWLAVYRDFGTVWTTCRQLHGPEYLDRGKLPKLGENLLIVVSGKDLINPADALVKFVETLDTANRPRIIYEPSSHHGVTIAYPRILNMVTDFVQ